ncbi:cyclic nucleotide-binding domain-containing protein [bacterium]|nr:cyclic nucleotide-binding domain-containing protein [bacterium]
MIEQPVQKLIHCTKSSLYNIQPAGHCGPLINPYLPHFMDTIKTNYIKNTNPELREQFIEILRRIPHFSGLSDGLLAQLFHYAKFVSLRDKERPVLEEMYGQEVYTLIRGTLDVYIKAESGEEKQVDVIYKPFSLFGEQCILGEQNNASIEARGDVLLLGIDISALPDLIVGLENPENRLEDGAYGQNTALYSVFANVLTERLDRLIKDQYKLIQRIMILHDSEAYQVAWQRNSLLTIIYNEFCTNELSQELGIQPILQELLASPLGKSKSLQRLLKATPVNTAHVYMELSRMQTLGDLEDLNSLLLTITQSLTDKARKLDRYRRQRQFQFHDIPTSDSLSDFLNETYETISEASLLSRPLSKETFLDAFLVNHTLNPTALAATLKDKGWINDEFSLACCLYLICKKCISMELTINQGIARAIHYLIVHNTPRQFIQSTHMKNLHLVKEVVDLFEIEEETPTGEAKSKKGSHQESVEDLLSEFGL